MDKLLEKWHSLTARERMLLGVAGAAIILFLIYSILVQPLQTAVSNVQNAYLQQQQLAAWMQPRVSALQASSGTQANAQPLASNERLSVIDARLKQADFASSVGQVSQTATGDVRVTLSQVPFDDLISWLTTQWQTSRVQVSDISIQREKKQGIVNATLALTS